MLKTKLSSESISVISELLQALHTPTSVFSHSDRTFAHAEVEPSEVTKFVLIKMINVSSVPL